MFKKILLLVTVKLLIVFAANATHLVGGSFTIKWQGGSTYEITLKVLRDCENGSPRAYFDIPLTAGIFDKANNQKKTEITFTNSDFVKDDTLDFTGANCPDIITGCTHIGVYQKTVTLASNIYNSNIGYYISWERCCRNNIINNIVNPKDAAMVLYAEFPNVQFTKNSTPYFTSNPVTLLCVNNTFKYNMNFVDDDGDVLKYTLIDPLNGNLGSDGPSNNGNPRSGPYPTTVWQNGYSTVNVIPGSIPLSINITTGEIICNPSSTGIFVSSILVEEYRFGIKIGEVRLELQFTVTNCQNDPPLSSVFSSDNQIITDTIYVKIPNKLTIKVRSIDIKDSVKMTITTPFIDSVFTNRPTFDTVINANLIAETFLNWQTDCEHSNLVNAIPFYVEAVDNGCPIPRNTLSRFYIKILPRKLLNPPKMLCMTLVDNKETIFYWGDSTDFNDPDFKMYYIYRKTSLGDTKIIDSITDKANRFYRDVNTPDYSSINYSYFMRAVNQCDSLGPSSDTIKTFNQLKFIPDKQHIKFVTVENNIAVKISWPKTWEEDFAKYYLYKSTDNGSSYNLLCTLEEPEDTIFVDQEVEVQKQSYCYYVVMKDTCDNIGPIGYQACTVLLKGDAAEFYNKLNWSNYIGWVDVEDYTVFRADPATPASVVFVNQPDNKNALDDKLNLNEGLFKYYVIATEKVNNQFYFNAQSQSNTVDLVQKPIVYMPNAFSKNGDGLNDNYYWMPVFVKDFKLQVYNRWGEKIFETFDKNKAWDGTYKGRIAPADVYFYTLYYNGWEGTEKTQSGNFTLIR